MYKGCHTISCILKGICDTVSHRKLYRDKKLILLMGDLIQLKLKINFF